MLFGIASGGNYLVVVIQQAKGPAARRIVQLFVVALVLLGSSLVLAGAAAAAPPRPTPISYSSCDGDGVRQFCFIGEGTRQVVSTKAGGAVFKLSGTFIFRALENGQIVQENVDKTRYVQVYQAGGNLQVVHSAPESSTFIVGSGTCSSETYYTYANGELRHFIQNFGARRSRSWHS